MHSGMSCSVSSPVREGKGIVGEGARMGGWAIRDADQPAAGQARPLAWFRSRLSRSMASTQRSTGSARPPPTHCSTSACITCACGGRPVVGVGVGRGGAGQDARLGCGRCARAAGGRGPRRAGRRNRGRAMPAPPPAPPAAHLGRHAGQLPRLDVGQQGGQEGAAAARPARKARVQVGPQRVGAPRQQAGSDGRLCQPARRRLGCLGRLCAVPCCGGGRRCRQALVHVSAQNGEQLALHLGQGGAAAVGGPRRPLLLPLLLHRLAACCRRCCRRLVHAHRGQERRHEAARLSGQRRQALLPAQQLHHAQALRVEQQQLVAEAGGRLVAGRRRQARQRGAAHRPVPHRQPLLSLGWAGGTSVAAAAAAAAGTVGTTLVPVWAVQAH